MAVFQIFCIHFFTVGRSAEMSSIFFYSLWCLCVCSHTPNHYTLHKHDIHITLQDIIVIISFHSPIIPLLPSHISINNQHKRDALLNGQAHYNCYNCSKPSITMNFHSELLIIYLLLLLMNSSVSVYPHF